MAIHSALNTLSDAYDYIIIGGGTAGCVLANRLSKDSSCTVLVVERGQVLDGWASKVPLFSSDFQSDGSRTRKTETLPNPALGDRKLVTFRGNVLGGSSRINQMLYVRGMPGEFNRWEKQGLTGWSYESLEHLFKKSESAQDPLDSSYAPFHGTTGLWKTRVHNEFYFPSSPRIIQAASELGIPFVEDVNSASAPTINCAKVRYTIDSHGRRSSAYHAFLSPSLVAERSQNLSICIGSLVTKIDVSNDAGNLQASAVNIRLLSSSDERRIKARKEIILCAGALGSPQIMMLSGLGPKAHLESLGIKVVKDLPGVGNHLQDHFSVPLGFFIPMSHSLLRIESGLGFLKEFFKYIFTGRGLILSPVPEIVLFANSHLLDDKTSKSNATPQQTDAADPNNLPDIEIMPIAYDASGGEFDKSKGAFSFLATLARPFSAGSLRLQSTDPLADPQIELGFLSDERDRQVMRKAIKLVLSIVAGLRKQGYQIDDYRVPESLSDSHLDAHITQWGRTPFHYSSSCRMAAEGSPIPGVVNERLEVYGVKGLRIADASVIPDSPAAHLQAQAVLVAEKCAEMILGATKV